MHSQDNPRVSKLTLRLFSLYVRMYLRRHLHAVRVVAGTAPGALEGWPVIVCLKHASWWDPLIALALAKAEFGKRSHYAPIDSASFSKYPFFKRIGFFGIEPKTLGGAKRFLHIGKAILSDPHNALWITGEGAFTDVRNRPVRLCGGIGHLVHSANRVALVPLAIEYTFWEERSPEALLCWGEPMLITNGAEGSPEEWTKWAAAAVESTLDQVAALSKRREKKAFDILLSGQSGIGGIYDFWRGLRAFGTGRRFTRGHGSEGF